VGIIIINTEEADSNHRSKRSYELKQWKSPLYRKKDFENIPGLPF